MFTMALAMNSTRIDCPLFDNVTDEFKSGRGRYNVAVHLLIYPFTSTCRSTNQ